MNLRESLCPWNLGLPYIFINQGKIIQCMYHPCASVRPWCLELTAASQRRVDAFGQWCLRLIVHIQYTTHDSGWRRGVAVTSLGVSTRLLYVGPGYYWDGWPSSAAKPPQYFTKPPRPTQPPTLSGTGNEYQPRCGDDLRLVSKGRYGSFHLWINVWVAGKTVWSLVNTCHTWAL